MKLADMTVAQFVAATASEEPAPGGGSVAALEAALGAALTAMVCNFTTGRKKWAEFEEKAKEMEQKALVLKEQAVDIIDPINEAIEFAKEYADKTDVRFINGVLNSYYKDNPTKEQPDA